METGYANGTGMVATAPAQAQLREREEDPRLEDGKLTKQFNDWDKRLDGHWTAWVDEAREAFDIVAGRQWDKDAEEAADDARLNIISVNRIDAIVSAVCGSEMTNRQEVRYYPREMATKDETGQAQDAVVNEMFTAAADWVRDECDAADEESAAFRDCVICGIGLTETRMDYETDPEGVALIMRVSPLEMRIDASARRPGATDAQYIRRRKPFGPDEAKLRFGVEGESGRATNSTGRLERRFPGSAYAGGQGDDETESDNVWITEYQWWELEKVWRVLNPNTGQIEELGDEAYQRIIQAMPDLEASSFSVKRRRYYRAFRVGDRILEATELPDEEFTYKFVTGKLDETKGVWYGIVRPMIEPQKLLNKQISQTQRIIDNNAKGGLLAEMDAFEDPEQAKLDWAASDSIVWLKPGSLGSSPRVMPKPIAQTPPGIDKLLAIAQEAVQGVSGVNNEMLGIIDREQAGVVDVQRKEAAYGVLKAFFNSLRRYRKVHGRHLLKLIQKYMTDGRLVRIVGRTGNVQYLPLLRDPNTARFDTIVDEAPTGPNQKDKVFQFLMMFGAPVLSKLNLPPSVWMKFLEFSPLPTALVSEMQKMIAEMPPQPNPEEEKAKAENAKLQADLQKVQMEMAIEQQRLQMDTQRLQMEMQHGSMKSQVDMSKVQGANQKLEVENQWVKIEMARAQMEQMNSSQEATLRARETQMREANDKLKIDADMQKLQADTEIRRMELEIKRAELEFRQQEMALQRAELEAKVGIERMKLRHASRIHNATLEESSVDDNDDGTSDAAPIIKESSAAKRMRELHELMSAPVEIEVDPVTGKKRARRVLPSTNN
jgi:hypothetical protein